MPPTVQRALQGAEGIAMLNVLLLKDLMVRFRPSALLVTLPWTAMAVFAVFAVWFM